MNWAQTYRVKWIKERDRNTRYFHTITTLRKRQNSIERLVIDGLITVDPEENKFEAMSFFRKFFREEHASRPTFRDIGFRKLSQDQAAFISARFSHEEINNAIASCDPSKAQGLGGFNFHFVKSAWDIIKEDVYGTIDEV